MTASTLPGPVEWPGDLLPPPFAEGAHPELLDVLPPLLHRPQPGRDLVLLLDGVGADLLREHRSLTPTLRRLEGEVRRIRTVAPSTTASAMVSLHTGLSPLEHGVIGYLTRDPATGTVVNQLTGDPRVRPEEWMPLPTPVEAGTRYAVQVAPAKHQRSHLTGAAYRGWDFLAHGRGDRVEAVRTALHRAGSDGLVHLHHDGVDHAGHHHGIDSEAWRDALAEADALLGALLRRLPRGTRIHVTADHGMVDTSPQRTIDLAEHPAVHRLIAEVAGEPRAATLFAVPGAEADLAGALRELLGERALVLEREEVLRIGLLGPAGRAPDPRVAGRLGDVQLLARGRWSIEDSSRRPAGAPTLIGVHGSLTAAESWVPLLTVTV